MIKYVVQPVNAIRVTTLLLQFNNKTSLLKTRKTGDLRFVILFLAFMNIPYGIYDRRRTITKIKDTQIGIGFT